MTPCRCKSVSFEFKPHPERAPDEMLIARYVSDDGAATDDRVASIMSRLARHESGHLIAAAAFGKQIDHATIGNAMPHVCYHMTTGEMTVDSQSLIDAAGLAAEGNIPGWDILGPAVRRAREGVTGFCDLCRLADLAVSAVPERSNFEMVNLLCDVFETAAQLFASPSWAGALDTLSSELENRTLLTGDDITRITSTFDLAGPLETIKPIWTKCHENGNSRILDRRRIPRRIL
jgi:hypothetical protein